MGDTPRKSYKDIMSASATDELAGGSPAVAKDGAEKEGGGPDASALAPREPTGDTQEGESDISASALLDHSIDGALAPLELASDTQAGDRRSRAHISAHAPPRRALTL